MSSRKRGSRNDRDSLSDEDILPKSPNETNKDPEPDQDPELDQEPELEEDSELLEEKQKYSQDPELSPTLSDTEFEESLNNARIVTGSSRLRSKSDSKSMAPSSKTGLTRMERFRQSILGTNTWRFSGEREKGKQKWNSIPMLYIPKQGDEFKEKEYFLHQKSKLEQMAIDGKIDVNTARIITENMGKIAYKRMVAMEHLEKEYIDQLTLLHARYGIDKDHKKLSDPKQGLEPSAMAKFIKEKQKLREAAIQTMRSADVRVLRKVNRKQLINRDMLNWTQMSPIHAFRTGTDEYDNIIRGFGHSSHSEDDQYVERTPNEIAKLQAKNIATSAWSIQANRMLKDHRFATGIGIASVASTLVFAPLAITGTVVGATIFGVAALVRMGVSAAASSVKSAVVSGAWESKRRDAHLVLNSEREDDKFIKECIFGQSITPQSYIDTLDDAENHLKDKTIKSVHKEYSHLVQSGELSQELKEKFESINQETNITISPEIEQEILKKIENNENIEDLDIEKLLNEGQGAVVLTQFDPDDDQAIEGEHISTISNSNISAPLKSDPQGTAKNLANLLFNLREDRKFDKFIIRSDEMQGCKNELYHFLNNLNFNLNLGNSDNRMIKLTLQGIDARFPPDNNEKSLLDLYQRSQSLKVNGVAPARRKAGDGMDNIVSKEIDRLNQSEKVQLENRPNRPSPQFGF